LNVRLGGVPTSVRELTVELETWVNAWENALPGAPERPGLLVMPLKVVARMPELPMGVGVGAVVEVELEVVLM